jgi:isoleucyl-tRNA synthetase
VRIQLAPGEPDASFSLHNLQTVLAASARPEVDNLADWLLVSELRIGGEPPEQALAQAEEVGLRLLVARAEGKKCERCWHYESDIGEHAHHPTLCGRCVAVLDGRSL